MPPYSPAHDPDLTALLHRINTAVAALPACPQTALSELHAARAALVARLEADDARTGSSVTDEVHLTARERQVLSLLARGERNKEIAVRLGLRERTIKFHVANLLAKLDASSRTEALRRAIELGLIEGWV